MKKIYFWGLIGLAGLGALFMVFAVFLNRGTLTINAETPYNIDIGQFRTEMCLENPCKIVLAPGDYTITLSKEGYREVERDVSVPLLGEDIEDINFLFEPYILEVGMEEDLGYFTKNIVEHEDLPEEYAGDEKYAAYIARNPENGRQTLYYHEVSGDVLSKEIIATSFIRDLQDPGIFPFIQDQNIIIVTDNTDEKSTLYLIDLEEKSRNNLLDYPLITGIKWLKNTDNFIFEARGAGKVDTEIYVYNAETENVAETGISTSINNVTASNDNTILAATTQSVSGVAAENGLEGQLVTMGERDATPFVTDVAELGTALPQLSFVQYSIQEDQARLIKTEESLSASEGVKLSLDEKGLLFLSDGKVYELRFKK